MLELHDIRATIELRDGARAFSSLLSAIKEVSDATCGMDEQGDSRDYRAMAAAIETSLRRNVFSAGDHVREGYVRSLTDFLCISADGCSVRDDWDPLRSTAAAFERRPSGDAT